MFTSRRDTIRLARRVGAALVGSLAACVAFGAPRALAVAETPSSPGEGAVHLAAHKPPPPVFRFAWREEIPEAARRLAVADVVGDGKPRLILLVEKPQQRGLATLLVKKWNGTAYVTEFTGDVQAAPDKLAVGKFAGPTKPTVIVTADAVWTWNGTTFARNPARKPISLFGAARLRTGNERLIISETPRVFKTYAVDPSAADGEWLTDRATEPTPSQVEWEDMHAAPEFFGEMGMPREFGAGGLIVLWDPHKVNASYLFYVRVESEVGQQNNTGGQKYNSFLAARDPSDAAANEFWSTQKLNGAAYDVATQDPRGSSKTGLLILTSDAAAGKSRTLYFYAMD